MKLSISEWQCTEKCKYVKKSNLQVRVGIVAIMVTQHVLIANHVCIKARWTFEIQAVKKVGLGRSCGLLLQALSVQRCGRCPGNATIQQSLSKWSITQYELYMQ